MCQVIVRTVKETPDWTYEVCTSCQKEVEIVSGKFRFEQCKRTIPFPDKRYLNLYLVCPIPTMTLLCGISSHITLVLYFRFRLCMIAEDSSGGAQFIVYNREVEAIVGKTVYDVLAEQERVLIPTICLFKIMLKLLCT